MNKYVNLSFLLSFYFCDTWNVLAVVTWSQGFVRVLWSIFKHKNLKTFDRILSNTCFLSLTSSLFNLFIFVSQKGRFLCMCVGEIDLISHFIYSLSMSICEFQENDELSVQNLGVEISNDCHLSLKFHLKLFYFENILTDA